MIGIDRVMQRTWRYWYEDGLTELSVGGLFAAVGALLLAGEVIGSAAGALTAVGLPVVVIGGMVLARKLVSTAKDRLVYPRTGYVAYKRKSGRRRALGAVAGGIMGALLAALFATAPASLAWLPAMDGFLIGGVWLWLAYRVDLGRFYVLGALSALIGTGLALAGLGETLGTAVYFLVEGVAMAASGSVGLLGYLRRTRGLAGAEGDER